MFKISEAVLCFLGDERKNADIYTVGSIDTVGYMTQKLF